MHLYPEEILPQEGSPAGIAAEDQPVAERGAVVRLVREGPVPKASCPHCGGNLQLSTVGSRWQVHGPKDVADQLILQLGTLEREELHVLVLNTRNLVVDQVRLYQGNVSASVVRVGELFRRAVELHASAIIIAHNHPSSDVTPSPDDLRLTAEALAAGRLLDIALLDHIIVGGGSYTSLRDRGIEFGNASDHRAGERSGTEDFTWNKATGGFIRPSQFRQPTGGISGVRIRQPGADSGRRAHYRETIGKLRQTEASHRSSPRRSRRRIGR